MLLVQTKAIQATTKMLSRPLLRAHARLCPTSGPTRRLSNVAASDLLKNVGKITSGMARTAGDDTMIVRGRGSYVEMHDGRQLLDFTTGIGVTGLGMSPSYHYT